MQYYDIHTHQPSVYPEDISVINIDLFRNEFESLPTNTFGKNFYSCGIHPRFLDNVKTQLEVLQTYLSLPEVVLLGEAGFDKLSSAPISLQEEVFLAQADLAEQYNKPMIIHCVRSWQEIENVKKRITPCQPWIIHGFRGNGILAVQLIHQGFYLSFGEYFNPSALFAAWPYHLFIETDDRPVDIRFVYRKIAETLSVDESRLIQQVADNIDRLGLTK